MLKSTIQFSLILILSNSSLLSQNIKCDTPQMDTIPFHLTDQNNIAIEAILNEQDTINLMFHTAIGSVSLTPDQTKALGENKNRKSSEATSWTGTDDVEYLEHNNLKIRNLEWEDITVWLDMLSGPGTDGKFGPHLFSNKIIEINYDQMVIVLHENQNIFLQLNEYEIFNLSTDENDSFFIEGTITIDGIKLKNKYLIHSGYAGTVILDDQYCKNNAAIKSLEVIAENDLKDSFGNIIKTKKALADEFKICNTEFENVPISYFDSALEIQKTSVVGCAFLKRFNMFLDIENMKLYAKPNNNTLATFKS